MDVRQIQYDHMIVPDRLPDNLLSLRYQADILLYKRNAFQHAAIRHILAGLIQSNHLRRHRRCHCRIFFKQKLHTLLGTLETTG